MIVDSIKALPGKRSRKVRIHLREGMDFCLYEKECRRLGLAEGEDFSDEAYEDMLAEILIPRAKRRAMHLLEKQDRTRANLSSKLKEAGYPPEAVSEALAYVESYHYIDDERYARNYVRYHQGDKSRRGLLLAMVQKGISREMAERAIEDEYLTSEEELISAILRKRHYDADAADEKERSRVYRYLCSKGFSSEEVMKFL